MWCPRVGRAPPAGVIWHRDWRLEFGLGVWGLGFQVWGSGLRVEGLRFRLSGLGCRGQG